MSPTFDPSGDFADVVDGLEPVTVVRRGTSIATAVPHAWRHAASSKEAAPSNGQYVRSDLHWWLPQAECAAAPRLGDEILDASDERWTVLAIAGPGPSGRWRCDCRNLVIAHRLDQAVIIEEVAYSKGEGGAAVATWTTWRSGVRARIQPAEVQVEDVLRMPQAVKKYLIFIADELPLTSAHRIKAADGALYRVTGWTAAQRIGELQTIQAERELPVGDP